MNEQYIEMFREVLKKINKQYAMVIGGTLAALICIIAVHKYHARPHFMNARFTPHFAQPKPVDLVKLNKRLNNLGLEAHYITPQDFTKLTGKPMARNAASVPGAANRPFLVEPSKTAPFVKYRELTVQCPALKDIKASIAIKARADGVVIDALYPRGDELASRAIFSCKFLPKQKLKVAAFTTIYSPGI